MDFDVQISNVKQADWLPFLFHVFLHVTPFSSGYGHFI